MKYAIRVIVSGCFAISLVAGCGGSPSNNPEIQGALGGTTNAPNKPSGGTAGHQGDGGSIGGSGEDGTDGGIIRTLKPALAIRAMGCVTCHARVNSPVITDFGYGGDGFGNNYYFGQNVGFGLQPFNGSIYGDHGDAWSSADFYSSVIVPNAPVNLVKNNVQLNTTLKGYLDATMKIPAGGTAKPPVVQKQNVYIGAPTAAQVLAIAGGFDAATPHWKYFPSDMLSPALAGLETKSNGAYVQNVANGTFACDGDLVINTVLFLNNVKLKTTTGCRIYTTNTVFIQGPIDYSLSGAQANLQIASSRAVLLGLGHGPTTINDSFPETTQNSVVYRLGTFWTRPGYATREQGKTTLQKLDTIVAESELISNLTDANLQPGGRAVGFSRLLLNAPEVHSRYQGQFRGVIVAEVALMSLSQFAFQYDPIFDDVSVLPRLDESVYLQVQD